MILGKCLAVVEKMQSGIRIKCKKKFGQFLATEKPYAIINDVETKELNWGKEVFIPLQPKKPYKITVQFPYMGGACAPASSIIEVKPDEIQVYEYNTPFLMTSNGSLKRKK